MIFTLGKQRIFTNTLTNVMNVTNVMMIVYVRNCVRDARAITELRMCSYYQHMNYESVSCAGTGAANAYTKRNIENPFPSTQMFLQARSKKCPQQYMLTLQQTIIH